jgi:hypothetical protein
MSDWSKIRHRQTASGRISMVMRAGVQETEDPDFRGTGRTPEELSIG